MPGVSFSCKLLLLNKGAVLFYVCQAGFQSMLTSFPSLGGGVRLWVGFFFLVVDLLEFLFLCWIGFFKQFPVS